MCLVYPGVSQLVDGVLWEHEARGSSPFTWTIKILTAIFIDYNTDDIMLKYFLYLV